MNLESPKITDSHSKNEKVNVIYALQKIYCCHHKEDITFEIRTEREGVIVYAPHVMRLTYNSRRLICHCYVERLIEEVISSISQRK